MEMQSAERAKKQFALDNEDAQINPDARTTIGVTKVTKARFNYAVTLAKIASTFKGTDNEFIEELIGEKIDAFECAIWPDEKRVTGGVNVNTPSGEPMKVEGFVDGEKIE